MIRLFTILFKTDFKQVPRGIELFRTVSSQFRVSRLKCPAPCKTQGQMDSHDRYERHLVEYDNGVVDHIVEVDRVKCTSCGHTHAILPDILVPYKSYCIIFILMVLKEYFHTRTATAISKKYGIAVSTLYAWRDRYLTHASLDLGAIVEAALLRSNTRWLMGANDICRADATQDFFGRFGFSFLQYVKTTGYSSA